jgi:hypothetical protein
VAPVAKPSPLACHVVQAPLITQQASLDNTLHLISLQPSSITATPLSTAAGFLVLRI